MSYLDFKIELYDGEVCLINRASGESYKGSEIIFRFKQDETCRGEPHLKAKNFIDALIVRNVEGKHDRLSAEVSDMIDKARKALSRREYHLAHTLYGNNLCVSWKTNDTAPVSDCAGVY